MEEERCRATKESLSRFVQPFLSLTRCAATPSHIDVDICGCDPSLKGCGKFVLLAELELSQAVRKCCWMDDFGWQTGQFTNGGYPSGLRRPTFLGRTKTLANRSRDLRSLSAGRLSGSRGPLFGSSLSLLSQEFLVLLLNNHSGNTYSYARIQLEIY